MATLLLDSSCGVELNASEEKALVEVLACAVRRAGGSTPSGLKGKGKVSSHPTSSSSFLVQSLWSLVQAMSARERRAVEQDKEAIASKLIPVLPDLISKVS